MFYAFVFHPAEKIETCQSQLKSQELIRPISRRLVGSACNILILIDFLISYVLFIVPKYCADCKISLATGVSTPEKVNKSRASV